MRTTEGDRSTRYESDALVRLIEDTIRAEPAQRRLYPDLYSEALADKIREQGIKITMPIPSHVFEVVPTPALADRFVRIGEKVRCVVCTGAGARGYDWRDYHGQPPQRWWGNKHDEHVRCTCGQIVQARGIGQHRASKNRHGKPCPAIGKGQ